MKSQLWENPVIRPAGVACRFFAPNMRSRAISALALLLAGLLPHALARTRAPAVTVTEGEKRDSYAIYSMLLKQLGPSGYPRILGIARETIIPQPRTRGEAYPLLPEPVPGQHGKYQSLIEDFKRRNAQPSVLERRFDLPTYRLLTVEEVKQLGYRNPPVPPPPRRPIAYCKRSDTCAGRRGLLPVRSRVQP